LEAIEVEKSLKR